MTFTRALSTNNYGCSKFIVSATPSLGTHTTISAANAVASSGDTIFIRDGTYTENVAMVAGVTYTTWNGEQLSGNVKVIGKWSFSGIGTCTISNLDLQTNSDYILEVTGSSASKVYSSNCRLNLSNNAGINFTSSSSSSEIRLFRCRGDTGTSGIKFWNMTSPGLLEIVRCDFENSGQSTTNSTQSAGTCYLFRTRFVTSGITTSSTAVIQIDQCTLITYASGNYTVLTHGGSASNCFASFTGFSSGSASAISISSTLTLSNCNVASTNLNAITGAGTLNNNGIFFTSTSYLMNTSTINGNTLDVGGVSFDNGTNRLSSYSEGTWTPVLGNTGTAPTVGYAANGQVGRYAKVGNGVNFTFRIGLSSYTGGTGGVQITGLPFTSANVTNQNYNTFVSYQNVTFGASVTSYTSLLSPNATALVQQGIVSAAGFTLLATSGPSASSIIGGTGWYSTA